MRAHPAWASWCKLVELFALSIQHSIKVSDIKRLDDLQLEHSALFDAVPEYNGLKRPKHHFLAHLAKDVWRYGPMRGYWCFGFDSFNKVFKFAAQHSNWKDTECAILESWSWKSARYLVECARGHV